MAEKSSRRDIVRVGKIKKRLEAEGVTNLTDEEIMSLYLPGRKSEQIGRAFLRLDKWKIFIALAIVFVAIIFLTAFLQEKAGNFTINLDRLELFRKGIAISSDAEFTAPTARLVASPVKDATNISIDDLPSGLDDIDGDHSGEDYMAYTYYVRNAGKEDVAYIATITIRSASKGVENAVRVALWRNTELLGVYAEPAEDGEPEPGTVPFTGGRLVVSVAEPEFYVGNVDKYTVVIWLEGDDPECVDAIVGGGIEFTMDISADQLEDRSLFEYYVQDVIDYLTGDKPINAAGTESPDYYKYRDVNWYTRRNDESVAAEEQEPVTDRQ